MVGDADDPVTTTKNITPIGTVARVLPDEDKLELVANAAIAVPAGLTVGATYGFIRGMLETSIELRAEFPSDNQGLVTGGSVYQLRIPYWDAEILRQLPKLTVREKF